MNNIQLMKIGGVELLRAPENFKVTNDNRLQRQPTQNGSGFVIQKPDDTEIICGGTISCKAVTTKQGRDTLRTYADPVQVVDHLGSVFDGCTVKETGWEYAWDKDKTKVYYKLDLEIYFESEGS